MVFYAGGCPRDAYMELLRPILGELGISILSFGRPNTYDVNKIAPCIHMLETGTSLEDIASILTLPARLVYHVPQNQ